MCSQYNALPNLPVKSIFCDLIGFLRRVAFSQRPTFILGLSGGVDSAAIAHLLVEAVGKGCIKTVIMHSGKNSNENIEDALLIANKLHLFYNIIDIGYCIDNYFEQFPEPGKMRIGNKLARERMAVLYDFAALYNGLVTGTGNRSELLLGYFTKYGDGGADIMPLGGLYKTYVYELASYLDVPEKIIKKPPSAGFWQGQNDEEDLGIEYKIADQILYLLVDKREDIETVIGHGFEKEDVLRVRQMVTASAHKREMPPIAYIAFPSNPLN